MQAKAVGLLILRLSLAFVFLWFGFSQLSDAAKWVSFVPDFAAKIIDPGVLVLLNGLFEVVAGSLLAIGIFPRYVALILGAHLLFIGGSMGFSPVGVRDIGLAFATMSFFFLAWSETITASPVLHG